MRISNKLIYTIIACCILIFAITASLVMMEKTALLDKDLFAWVIEQRRIILDKIFVCITYMGNWQTVTIIGIALLLVPLTCKKIGIPFVIATVLSSAIYKLLKDVFQRMRPPEELHLVQEHDFSFPSGHSMNCMVCYGILIYLIRKYCPNRVIANILTVVLSILIICIGSSRVYVGVHYPTDVIGGWAAGMAFLMIAIRILEKSA